MRLHLNPFYRGEDKGDGGIRRVVEAQQLYLPELGIEIVSDPTEADVCAMHAGNWTRTQGPTVSHCHGLYWQEYEWPEWALQVNRDVVSALHKADVVTAPSEWVANVLRKGMWLDPIVINHGVDTEEWTPGENEGYILWNKTRVDPVCEVDSLNRFAKELTSAQFVSTYGNKDLPNLIVTGTLPYEKAKEVVRNAGIYLCTTRETFGIGTLEAMACGVPILGWNWGGQREIVTHKENGWLAAPGDFDGLKEGYEFCTNNRERLSKNARESAARFTWRRVMPLYKYAYNEATKRRNPTARVSVVITNYKLEHFLEDAVNSVLRQAFNDYEIIIVNDASPTWTKGIEEELKAMDPRIRVINNPENLYLAGALNVGIKAARGRYIVPLDADNMLGERSLAALSEALDKDRDTDIVYGAMEVIEENGKREVSSWPGDFSYRQQLAHRNQLPSTSMYRKSVWERAGGYRSRCRTAEDADFWCRVSSLGAKPRRVTDAVVLHYRNRSDSMSHVEKDWNWHEWYPKGAMGATYQISSYEPELISIVIPVGPGHTRLIVDALDSVWAQTFQKWEVIVVNDSGESFDWIHPFARVLTTGPEGGAGPAIARNLGIAAAKGKLVLLLDADDYLQPKALEEMYRAWRPGAYVYSDWYTEEKVYQAPDYNCNALLQGLPHAVTVLFPRSVETRFDEGLEGWEDWDFILSLNKEGLCGTRVPRPLFIYRTLKGNRREELYAKREELKKNIYRKWEPFIEGKETLMGCGCGGAQSKIAQLVGVDAAPPNGDYILLEFIAEELAPRTYKGPKTGAMYRFGGMGRRTMYVHKDDAMEFLMRPEFAEAGTSDTKLEVLA